MLRWILFIFIYVLIGFYGFQAVKTVTSKFWVHVFFAVIGLLVLGNFIFQFTVNSDGRNLSPIKAYAIGFLLSFLVFNLVIIPILLGEDIYRVILGIYDKFVKPNTVDGLTSRRKFISQIALGVAAIPFLSLLYGMYKGRYNFKVLRYSLYFEDLPTAFDGYKITQISDIHSGSFDNKEKIEYAVQLVNEQESDLLLFTGDLINNKATEMLPWIETFKKLKAKDGKFSILGNHDYGDYIDWPSKAAKEANLNQLKDIQEELGFKLLLNEHTYIKKKEDKIALIGVENWGKGGFKKAGDLKKAVALIKADDFKILMSHDPSHWEEQVIPDDYHYHLTLSGHTHGMQFGIEIPGWIKWSPAKWRYKYWAGIYQEMNQYINVNRGFGYLAYPGRVGIWPEVTVIELKKGTKPV